MSSPSKWQSLVVPLLPNLPLTLCSHVQLTFHIDFLLVFEYTLHFHPFVIWLMPFPLLVPLVTLYSDSEVLLFLCWEPPL